MERVALITGGARGIPRAVALALAKQGWRVAICYRNSAADAAAALAEIQSRGAAGLSLQADVSDYSQAEALVARVEKEWGRIDALINGAGPYHYVPLLDETVAGWHEMFANNLDPVFYLGRLVAAGMKSRGWGRIVNFSMANADKLVGQANVTAHYIAKVGVLVLTRSLARILAPHGITVNSVSPGFIDSGSLPPEEYQKMVKTIPAGYVGAPPDVVNAVLFLLAEESGYVNGANIEVGGAWKV